MIPIILMIFGGLLIVISLLGLLAYVFQPVYEDFQVVIKREDDYAHYATPSGQAFLQKRVKRYISGIIIMLVAGCILFFSGLYMGYGSKGFNMLFSTKQSGDEMEYDAIDSELAEGFDSRGNYVTDDGKIYTHYLVVKGNAVYYKDELIGDADDLRVFVQNMNIENSFYIVDGYASASAYKEVMNILSENGFEYEIDE